MTNPYSTERPSEFAHRTGRGSIIADDTLRPNTVDVKKVSEAQGEPRGTISKVKPATNPARKTAPPLPAGRSDSVAMGVNPPHRAMAAGSKAGH